jgi:hypothetical protein
MSSYLPISASLFLRNITAGNISPTIGVTMIDAFLRLKAKATTKNPISKSESRQTTRGEGSSPWYNPRSWSFGIAFCVFMVCSLLLATVISIIVGQTRKNEYPDYRLIPYSLIDTYEGPSFFDQFNYFSDVDPTHGFVKYTHTSTSDTMKILTQSDTPTQPQPTTSI